jgi:hypothetical protein
MGPNIEQELRYPQPGTARLSIGSDGALLVSAEDIIEVDVAAVNRLLVTEHAMLRQRGQLPDDTVPPPFLEERSDGTLFLDDLRYLLVRRDRRNPEVALYERAN